MGKTGKTIVVVLFFAALVAIAVTVWVLQRSPQ